MVGGGAVESHGRAVERNDWMQPYWWSSLKGAGSWGFGRMRIMGMGGGDSA